MRFKIQIIITAFLIGNFVVLKGQETVKPGSPNELDKQYTPDKSSSTPSNSVSSSGSIAGKNNFVKFNFALLARSTCAFFL